ncbi:flavodoxin domain protein [Clostridioides difficile CD17]|nr:flavodoxin domain protein [Clostridioides difficile]EQE15405.1 flavodoxin domain protein [Clostridioides difficile CD17]
MKSLVLYSSLTGNTKKIAYTIYDEIQEEKDIKDVNELVDYGIDYENYDIVFLGYWVTREFVIKIQNKCLKIFTIKR